MEGKKSIGGVIAGMVPGFIAVVIGTTVALVIYSKFLKKKIEGGSEASITPTTNPIIAKAAKKAPASAQGSDDDDI